MNRSISAMDLVIGLLFVLVGVGVVLASMQATELVGTLLAAGAALVAVFILNQRNNIP